MSLSFHHVLLLALLLQSSFSWVPSIQPVGQRKAHLSTVLFLTPDQAKDLEAFAEEFLKPAIEEDADENATMKHIVVTNADKQRSGPLSWCVEQFSKRALVSSSSSNSSEELALEP